VQAGPQRQVVHLALHTILQHLGEACNLAVVEHLDLRGQQFKSHNKKDTTVSLGPQSSTN